MSFSTSDSLFICVCTNRTLSSSLTSYLMFSSRHCALQKHSSWIECSIRREYLCHFFFSRCLECQRVKKINYDANLKQPNKVTLGCFSLVKTLKALKMLLKLYGFFFHFVVSQKLYFKTLQFKGKSNYQNAINF